MRSSLAPGMGQNPGVLAKIGEILGMGRDWLDERGKPAWIIAMILGFVAFWPIGLAVLGYMIWSKRMTCGHRHHDRQSFRSSGNTAFDAYRDETIRRLEDEQAAFREFLSRLRAARDKAEFDQFMAERAQATARAPSDRAEI